MKINSSEMIGAGKRNSESKPIFERKDFSGNSAFQLPSYRRSEMLPQDRRPEASAAKDAKGATDGAGLGNQRFHPYARPLRSNLSSHATHFSDQDFANQHAAHRLFDEMRALLPGDPHVLDFEAEGQPYQLKVFDSGTFMIDRPNSNPMLYSMIIDPINGTRGLQKFPGGSERLASFLASASARLQYISS